MQNSLGQIPDQSQQKILSTQNSRSSTFVLFNQEQQREKQNDSSFRLFTFMKQRNQQYKNLQGKSKNNRKKSVKKLTDKGLKRDSSELITIIQQSRKKREDFLKLIMDSQLQKSKEKDRKCLTPTNLRLSNNNLSVKYFNSKKCSTPRANTNRQFLEIKQSKLKKKSFSIKNSHSQFKINCTKKQQKAALHNIQKIHNKEEDKIHKQQHIALLEKKKDLQKQLLQINQTLLLGRQKKKVDKHKIKK